MMLLYTLAGAFIQENKPFPDRQDVADPAPLSRSQCSNGRAQEEKQGFQGVLFWALTVIPKANQSLKIGAQLLLFI